MKFRQLSRRGATLVLAAFLMVALLGMVAFAIDIGYLVLVKAQLQTAADAGALAATQTMGADPATIRSTAKTFANYHKAGGKTVSLTDSDVEFGTWNSTTKAFAASTSVGNAVRVTARRNNTTGGNTFFFAKIFGQGSFTTQASAIAMGNPRDICFVVDLSGSMNDDTEPCWATNALSGEGFGTVANAMNQQLYTDMNFGTAPGTVKWVGEVSGTGISSGDNKAYAKLTMNGGYLSTLTGTANAAYKVVSGTGSGTGSNYGDSEATRKTKAYKWIIDKQLAVIMPNAKPTPSSTASYAYWEKYLDYVLEGVTVSSGTGSGSPSVNRGALPPSQDSDRVTGFNNPNTTSFPSASGSVPQGFRNKLGYQTYVQYMLDFGRNNQPDGANYTQLSVSSPNCRYHNEVVGGTTFSFPPSEQPTHSARRSLIAAIQEIQSHNSTISDMNQRDWVSVVTFDTVAGTVLKRTLTGDYAAAMTSCTTFQAVGDNVSSTATETGLIAGMNHIKPASQGGAGREHTQKVVVLLTDGMANLQSSSNATINNYVGAHSSPNFYSSGGNYSGNAALMQAMSMQLLGWRVFPVGLGLGCEYDFMDRMARNGSTANSSGQSPRTSGDPSAYEVELTNIFKQIITNPEVRLVQ